MSFDKVVAAVRNYLSKQLEDRGELNREARRILRRVFGVKLWLFGFAGGFLSITRKFFTSPECDLELTRTQGQYIALGLAQVQFWAEIFRAGLLSKEIELGDHEWEAVISFVLVKNYPPLILPKEFAEEGMIAFRKYVEGEYIAGKDEVSAGVVGIAQMMEDECLSDEERLLLIPWLG